MTFNDPGTQYARKIVNGDIVAGKKIIKACQRHLDDLEKENFDYVYLPKRAEIAVKFMELLPDISTGQSVKMAQFQLFIIYSLYGPISIIHYLFIVWLVSKRKYRFTKV